MKRILPAGVFRAYVSQRISAERDAEGRVWCPLFPVGEWHRGDFPGGKLELSASLFEEFIANWRDEGAPALPVDYEHVEDDIASGWIEDLRIGASGGLEGAIRWTDAAASEIKADQRRYISPTWAMAHVNRRTGEKSGPWLYGAALTNTPFFDSMPRVAATATPVAETTQPPAAKDTKKMTPELKKRLASALKCAEDCTDEELVAKCEASMSSMAASIGTVEGKLTASHAEATKLQARNAELENLVKANEEALFERDFEAVFTAGLNEGKAGLPAMKDTLKATAKALGKDGLASVKTLIASMGNVALKPVGVTGTEDDGSSKSASAQWQSLVDEKVKAGMSFSDASRAVNLEHRAVVEKAFTVTTTKPAQG